MARARFAREARAVAALESDYVVRVLDFGVHDGTTPFMVMQHLAGRDLAAEVRARGALPIAEAVDCAIQACAGLADAHAHGIVHRDIKPGNLFMVRRPNGDPLVKILDFGISKAPREDDDERSLTDTGSMLGSPMYMSPEQLRQSKAIDHRTDIWSLGVVLYHLLSGRRPFDAEGGTSYVEAVIADPMVPIMERREDVPRGLGDVIARCLEKTPAYRYASAAELARALAPFASARGANIAQSIAPLVPAARGSAEARPFDDGTLEDPTEAPR